MTQKQTGTFGTQGTQRFGAFQSMKSGKKLRKAESLQVSPLQAQDTLNTTGAKNINEVSKDPHHF